MNEPKPGYLTTEFWVTAATIIGSFVVALFSADRAADLGRLAETGAHWIGLGATIAAGVSAGLYALGRSLLKK